jgi:hypothetical protein
MIAYLINNFRDADYNLVDHENIHIAFFILQKEGLDEHLFRSFIYLSKININLFDDRLGSLFYQGILNNKSILLTNLFIELGANVNCKDDMNNNIIFYCVLEGLTIISSTLIKTPSFDVNCYNLTNENILEVAIIKNMVIHSSILLDIRPNLIKNKNTIIRLMHHCVERGNTIVAFRLLQHYSAFVIQQAIKFHLKK